MNVNIVHGVGEDGLFQIQHSIFIIHLFCFANGVLT